MIASATVGKCGARPRSETTGDTPIALQAIASRLLGKRRCRDTVEVVPGCARPMWFGDSAGSVRPGQRHVRCAHGAATGSATKPRTAERSRVDHDVQTGGKPADPLRHFW